MGKTYDVIYEQPEREGRENAWIDNISLTLWYISLKIQYISGSNL